MRELFFMSLVCVGVALSDNPAETCLPIVAVATAVAVADVSSHEVQPAVVRKAAPGSVTTQAGARRRCGRLFNRRNRR